MWGPSAEIPKMGHHKTESQQRDPGTNPGEKRSLFSELLAAIGDGLFFKRVSISNPY
jgi:hypothetical protein